ncbi:MAG: hypothetical protein JWR42_1645, partial [Marmoricola sp.]|nr:hypothetical protein [Marmoricola sp.]
AAVTAALLVTPADGSTEVNGEVLAAPFLALTCAFTVRALRDPGGRARPALLAGACAVAAVLVKQNLVDGLIWGAVATLASAPALGVRRAGRVLALAAAGGAAALGLTVAWTVLHGTSPAGVWWAMYPFRLAARDSLLLAHPGAGVLLRRHLLVRDAGLSGVVLVAALLGALVLVGALDLLRGRRRAGRPAYAAAGATAVTLAWGAVSIDLGGGWWLHYLVQLVVPLGLAAGLVAHRWPRTGSVTALLVSASAALALVLLGPTVQPPGGNPVGRAVGEVARPGDTIVTVFGNSDVTRASGLESPYPYLWILPTAVLDPRLELLVHTLEDARAPTWFVALGSTHPHFGPGAPALRATLREHYRRVADLGGSGVWLHDGVRRNAPVVTG